MRILRVDVDGSDVRDWQDFLREQGFDSGRNDGQFGDNTELATKDFQNANRLTRNGVVGNETLAVAMAKGFAPLPDVNDPAPSDKTVKVRVVAGVPVFKLKGGEAVFFTSRMHVDADGCPQAYAPKNVGIEDNKAARKKSGAFSGDVLVLGGDGEPVLQGGNDPAPGFFISKTALTDGSRKTVYPTKYVDALKVPYIVIPGVSGGIAVKAGDVALGIDQRTGIRVKAIVGDVGPSDETGEASMFLAGLIAGLKVSQITEKEARNKESFMSPCGGGTEKKHFRYTIFPRTTLKWPKSNTEIEARIDGALAALTNDQLLAIAS
jgi:peptidoglycan hydrolase-like protein with peptidoglycan-binding domain